MFLRILPALSALLVAQPALAQAGEATFGWLYFYEVTDSKAFDAGYRRHLDWHAEAGDHLSWYGWRIVAGTRAGQFVDGAFTSTEAFDRRPRPAEDGADFAENVAPHAKPAGQQVVELLPHVSRATPLETRKAPQTLDVYVVQVAPNDVGRFEAALAVALPSARRDVTWYRSRLGGALPEYLLLAPRLRWTDLDAAADAPSIFGAVYGDPARIRAIERHVRSVRTETWTYDSALSRVVTD